MIRINLLPGTEKKRRPARRRPMLPAGAGGLPMWLGIYTAAIVLSIAGFAGAYYLKNKDLQALMASNEKLGVERDELEKKTSGLAEVEAKLEKSRQLEEVIKELERARRGPTRAVMELSKLLSQPGGPTIDERELEKMRRENPLAGYNEDWDVRRIWLTRFEETDRACQIQGRGRTNDDVAEFLRRLSLSELFTDVTLQRTRAVSDKEVGVDTVGFELSCTVNY